MKHSRGAIFGSGLMIILGFLGCGLEDPSDPTLAAGGELAQAAQAKATAGLTIAHPRDQYDSSEYINDDDGRIRICRLSGGTDCDYATIDAGGVGWTEPYAGIGAISVPPTYPWSAEDAWISDGPFDATQIHIPLVGEFDSGGCGITKFIDATARIFLIDPNVGYQGNTCELAKDGSAADLGTVLLDKLEDRRKNPQQGDVDSKGYFDFLASFGEDCFGHQQRVKLVMKLTAMTTCGMKSAQEEILPIDIANDDDNKNNPGTLDFAFVIDTTGSMWDDIAAVKASSIDIVDKIFDDVPDARVALIDYKDFPLSPFGGPTDYPHRVVLDFSADRDQVIAAIQSLAVGGGADMPESVYSGLIGAIAGVPDHLGNTLSSWRGGAKKSILLLGDAPPHDPEPVSGYTLQDVVAAANAGGVVQSVSITRSLGSQVGFVQSESGSTATGGISIYTLQIGSNSSAQTYFQALSGGTGGESFMAAGAGAVVEIMTEIIGDITDDVEVNRPPDTLWARPTVDLLFPPNHQMITVGIQNVIDPEGGPVTITITAITQDEPVGASGSQRAPDGAGVGSNQASVRAERDGSANGRVYRIDFLAEDALGAASPGSVFVCVPRDQGANDDCHDDGQVYDSVSPSATIP